MNNTNNTNSLAELNELIFDNSDKMNEGLYLQLMNATKKIFEEQKKQEQKQQTQIITRTLYKTEYVEHNKYMLNKITLNPNNNTLSLYNDNDNICEILREDDMLEVMSLGKDKTFIHILKVSKNTVKYVNHFFKYSFVEDTYIHSYDTRIFKYNVNLKKHNIIFYVIDSETVRDSFETIKNKAFN